MYQVLIFFIICYHLKHVHPTAPIITHLETVLCKDGYV